MSERRDMSEQVAREYWTVFVDLGGGKKEEWFTISTGIWSSLELMVEDARQMVENKLGDWEMRTTSFYLNVDKHTLTFYTCSKQDEWWTL